MITAANEYSSEYNTYTRDRWINTLIAGIVLTTYGLCYAFKYMPITEGWFSEYAHLFNRGFLPYKDFELLTPPLYPFLISLTQSIMGDGLFSLKLIGVFITSGIGMTLYLIVTRLFSPSASLFASLTATFYYQSGNAYIGYDYTQVMTLLMLVSTFLILQSDNVNIPSAKRFRLLVTSGVIAGLAFNIKQSNTGLWIALSLFGLFFTPIRITPRLRAIGALLWISSSLSVSVIIMAYLGKHGVILPYLKQTLILGPTAKGGVFKILTGWLIGFFTPIDSYLFWSYRFVCITLFLLILAYTPIIIARGIPLFVGLSRGHLFAPAKSLIPIGRFSRQLRCLEPQLIGLLFASLPILSYYAPSILIEPATFIHNIANPLLILGALNIVLVGGCITIISIVTKHKSIPARWLSPWLPMLGFFAGNGTSGGLTEISAFLGLAFYLAFLFDLSKSNLISRLLILIIGLLLSTSFIEKKYNTPYSWWGVTTQDIRSTPCEFGDGIMAGLCLPNQKLSDIGIIEKEIKRLTGEERFIYIYPHIPIFYILSGKLPFSGAVISWFDFMSDEKANEVASNLAQAPPSLIIYAHVPNNAISVHETLFRGGRTSGQRNIENTIEALLSNRTFCPTAHSPIIDNLIISLYVKCDHVD